MEENDRDKEKQELVPTVEYEVIDQADDQAIVEMMTGQAIQDYVYSFKQSGRVVEGLTLAGINEAANRRGGIVVEDIQFEEREDSWIAIVKATDSFTGSSRYGAFEQPKKTGSRDDPFAFTKAIHKAQRNAIKQLLPVPIIKEVLNYYLHGQKSASIQSETALSVGAERTAVDKKDSAQKSVFTMASRLRERLEQQGISQTDFWGYVKRRYNVTSRDDMTEGQWTQLSKELSLVERNPESFKELISRIRQVQAAQADAEIISEDVPPFTKGGQGGFTGVNRVEPEETEIESPSQDTDKPHDSLF
ncbi:TPA: hypothetical protein EYP66_02495 [Candidatus Poribacteria bacterium]|nr:hypothetical protein [Candidatus Poribacteria bacterium]